MLSGTFGYDDISTLVAQNSKNDKKKQEAATIIQKNWRGFTVRNHFSKPSIIYPPGDDLDPRLPVGNDPISHLEKHVTLTKHPAILATGGVQCLHNAIKLTTKDDGQLGEKPKIFLMDYNPEIITFWKLLQRSFRESENVESFLEKLPRHTDEVNRTNNERGYTAPYPPELTEDKKYSQWLIAGGITREAQRVYLETKYPEINIDRFHPLGLYDFFSQLLNGDQNRFNWIKSTVTNQIHLIQNCWIKSRESFQFIKRVCEYHNYQIFVYASNIKDTTFGSERELIDNISILKPAMVVETKTLWRGRTGWPMLTHYIDIS